MPLYFDYTFNMHTCILSNIKKNSCTKLNNRLIIQSNKFLYKGFLENEHLLIPSYIFFLNARANTKSPIRNWTYQYTILILVGMTTFFITGILAYM